jgi:hypothetical protein
MPPVNLEARTEIKSLGVCSQHVQPHNWHGHEDVGRPWTMCMTRIKTGFERARVSDSLPQNHHHASLEREDPVIGEDRDSSCEHSPFPSTCHPRIRSPFVLLSTFRESAIATFTTSLDSHRTPPLSPPAGHFEAESIVDSTTATVTWRSHAPSIHPGFAFGSGVIAGMGYRDWVHALLA